MSEYAEEVEGRAMFDAQEPPVAESVPELRVLSVRQPWAWAIVHGGKDVENRVRNVAGGYRGLVAIHASRTWDSNWPEDSLIEDAMLDEMARLRRQPWPWNEHRGAIVGVVELVDVHTSAMCWEPFHPGGPRYCSPWAEVDAQHLKLQNPRPLVASVPWKGALHLQRLTVEETVAILRRVA